MHGLQPSATDFPDLNVDDWR